MAPERSALASVKRRLQTDFRPGRDFDDFSKDFPFHAGRLKPAPRDESILIPSARRIECE